MVKHFNSLSIISHFLVELMMTNVKIADKCRFDIRLFAELRFRIHNWKTVPS